MDSTSMKPVFIAPTEGESLCPYISGICHTTFGRSMKWSSEV